MRDVGAIRARAFNPGVVDIEERLEVCRLIPLGVAHDLGVNVIGLELEAIGKTAADIELQSIVDAVAEIGGDVGAEQVGISEEADRPVYAASLVEAPELTHLAGLDIAEDG